VSPLLSPCTEDDEESPGVDNLEDVWLGVGVGLVTLPLLRVRWGHGVEWKELRMGGARCEVGDAGTAGRREVKSPPTRGRGEVESYGQQGGDTGDGGWWMRECHG
jgi:hypothetical protein